MRHRIVNRNFKEGKKNWK